MSKRDAFYEEIFDDDGIQLSDDAEVNAIIGRRLLGACLVAKMDIAIDQAIAMLDCRLDPTAYLKPTSHEESLKVIFASLNDAQKSAVRELIRDTTSGMLFAICSKLDQFPGLSLSICVETIPSDDRPPRSFVIASDSHDELHSSYFDWIADFSDEIAIDDKPIEARQRIDKAEG